MKRFKIVLRDNRQEFVNADDWITDDDRYLFLQDGQTRGDIFFLKDEVMGITVEVEDLNRKRPNPNPDRLI